MSIESLLFAAKFLDSQEEGYDDLEPGPSMSNSYCNSPPSTSSSNDGMTKKYSPKSRSPTQRNGVRRSESNRSINREVHNRLEKNRRAQMKEGFERLKKLVPSIRGTKISSLALLRGVTMYINNLAKDGENLQSEKSHLKAQNQELVKQRNVLKRGLKLGEKSQYKPVKQESDNESTSTASEGDEMDELKPLRRSPEKRSHQRAALSDIQKKKLLVENASRPSVVVSAKDKQLHVAPENKEKLQILYSQLTSAIPATSAASTSKADDTSFATGLSDPGVASSCYNFDIAESLLQLCSHEDVSPKNEMQEGKLGQPILKVEQNALLNKQLLQKNNTFDNKDKLKGVRKRKPVLDKKVLTSDSQEVKPRASAVNIKEEPVAKFNSEIKTVKETAVLSEDKAKYIVAFRPYSAKNSLGFRPAVAMGTSKQVASKMLVNACGTKVGSSEQYLLISGNQANSATLDSKPQVMILENELKFISCKPLLKHEPSTQNSDLKIVKAGNEACENSATTAPDERVVIQERKVNTIDAKDILHGSNGSLAVISDKKSQDVTFHVPASVLPSLGLVLSSVGNNRTLSEMQFCMAPQKSQHSAVMQKVFPANVQQANNSILDRDHLLKANQPNNFGAHSTESKLYLIAVPNPNKTIQVNGNNI